MNIIETIEAEHAAKLPGAKMPAFQPGDTVVVNVKVAEGERTRVQAYDCLLYTSPSPRDA